MLTVNTLQPPQTGRSRFSKALPAVPGMHDDNNINNTDSNNTPIPSPASPTKDLPIAPPAPPPPPRGDSLFKSTISSSSSRSPLPALPLLKTANSPPSAPPKMAIPRRPVGFGLPAGPRPPQQQQLQKPQSQFQSSLPAAEPPSPSFSLSSILSAYSRSSGESLVRDSDVPISARESEATISPSDEAALRRQPIEALGISYATPKANDQSNKPAVAPTSTSDDTPPPPPPSKDDKYHISAPTASAQSNEPVVSPSSPPQPQIWRRRSVNAERNLELPNLSLPNSNGSTASTQQTTQPTQHMQMQPPPGAVKVTPISFQQPRIAGGLPGRDIRPTPPQEQVADTQAMGNSSSKLKKVKDKLQSFHRRGKSSSDTTVETVQRGAHRPPTPEYQKEDIKTPIIDTFVSPVSPASSPELSTEVSPALSGGLASVASSATADVKSKPIARKAIPSDLGIIQPAPEPTAKKQQPATEPFPALNPAVVGNRGSSGSDSGSSNTPRSTETAKFPPRKSSARSNISRVPDQFRQPAPGSDPRLIQTESQGPMYRGRDGTLYPEMKVLQEPDPQAFYFPKQAAQPIPEDTILKAVPLKGSHYNCFHGHKTMNRRTNRNHPLTCQTCEKSDAEDRWACTFCHLRICEFCYHTFNAHQRDLRKLVDAVQHKA